MSDLTLKVEEAARLLGIGRSAAYEAVRRGEIPSVRIGRRVLVCRHQLLDMVGVPTPTDGYGSATAEPLAATAPANGTPKYGAD
jgi:excisionase family DNA binding protein